LYTYEVQWTSPACNVRKVVNGDPRLTVDATITIEGIIKVNGSVVYRAPLFSQVFADITTSTSESGGKGNIGTASGVEGISQRVYGGSGPFSLYVDNGNVSPSFNQSTLTVDPQTFGSPLTTSIIKLRASLKNSYVGNFESVAPKKFLGSTQNTVASTAHFNLGGGYIVDCLTDKEARTSDYRSSASNPYNEFGLPENGMGAPPDLWFYMTDEVSRRGALFSPHLRDSCGMLGTSSAAIGLQGNVVNGTLCCDGSLTNGACAPGSGHPSAFESPKDITTNGTLWKSSFSPPGYRSYNYYLFGRNRLYMQPPKQSVSGLSPVLNGASTAVFEIVIEFADLMLRAKSGASATQASVPPIRLEAGTSPVFQAYSQEPVSCVYNTDGNGRGAIIFQRLCNAGSGAATANVSIIFEDCVGLQYVDPNGKPLDEASPIAVLKPPLPPGQCYDMFSLPVFIEAAFGVDSVTASNLPISPQCKKMFASSTLGSTRDAVIDGLVCTPLPGFWNDPVIARGSIVTINDIDPNCERCEPSDLGCLDQCGLAYKSIYMFIIFWVPYVMFSAVMVIYIIVGIVGEINDREFDARMSRRHFGDNNTIRKRLKMMQ
jgi:hypothetical protein